MGEIAFSTNESFKVAIDGVTVTEGHSGTVNAQFYITLEPAPEGTETVTVYYKTEETEDDTAKVSDNDYAAADSSVVFSAGQIIKGITIQVNGDTRLEPNETFHVKLTSAVTNSGHDGVIIRSPGVGTILNDDSTTGTSAAATIATNDRPGLCPVPPHLTGGHRVTTAGNTYDNLKNPHPIITLETQLVEGAAAASITSFDVQLRLKAPPGASYSDAVKSQTYNVSNLAAEQQLRFALQVDASAFETGMHAWEMSLTTTYPGSSVTDTYTGTEWVTNWTQSPFGTGRWLEGLDQLYLTNGGVGLVYSHGGVTFFADDGQGGYVSPDHAINSLVYQNGVYTLTYFDGTVKEFRSDGKIASIRDRNSNQTSYTYNAAGELITLTGPSGRATSFAYHETSRLLVSSTEFDRRTTDFNYNADRRLTSVLLPGPAGIAERPQIQFEYDETTGIRAGLLTEVTDELGRSTSFVYDDFRRLQSTTAPSASGVGTITTQLQSLQSRVAASTDPKLLGPRDGQFTDEFGRTTVFSTDRFGLTTYERDQEGKETIFVRKETCGRIDEAIYPDPDGDGPRGVERTLYTYDTMFKNNITELRHVVGNVDGQGNTETDDIVERWSYGLFGQVTQYVDAAGRTTNFLLDEWGNVTTMIEVGDPGDPTDDLITRFTHTAGGSGIAKGLVATETSPTGATTLYEYYGDFEGLWRAGQLKRVIHPNTTPLEPLTPAGEPVIIDDGAAGFTASANWQSGASSGRDGDHHVMLNGTADDTATWTFSGLAAGRYLVSATWQAHPQYVAIDVPFTILDGASPREKVLANQAVAPDDLYDQGSFWEHLAAVNITGDSLVVTVDASSTRYTLADAVRIQRVGDLPSTPEIAVLVDGRNIADETGYVGLGVANTGAPLTKTFTVVNLGAPTTTLNLGSITLPAGYSLDSQLGATILGGGQSTTFVVKLNAIAAGDYSGQISIASDDSNENPFNFTIAGSATAPAQIVDNDTDPGGPFEATSGWSEYEAYYAYGEDWHYAVAEPGTGAEVATWKFTVTPGFYRVSATWAENPYNAGNAPFTIHDHATDYSSQTQVGGEAMNQTESPDDLLAEGFYWEQVGQVVKITGTTLVVKVTNNANGYGQADAVRIDQVPAPQRPPRAEERFDYDQSGNLQRHVSEVGQVTTWEYNSLDQLVETVSQDPDGLGDLAAPRTTYVRDLAGNITSRFDTDGTTTGTETRYEYTPQDWVKKITRGANKPDPAVTEWKHDDWGRVIEETVRLDAPEGADRVTNWQYDDALRTVTITMPDPDGPSNPLERPVYVRKFDLRGNLVQLVEPDPDGAGTVYVSPVTDFKYDRMDRLELITGATVNSVRPVTAYTYNKAGQVLSVRDAENRDTINTYDDLGRLLTVTDELNHTTTLGYDRASNVVSVKDHLSQVTSHAFDARDHRISTTDARSGMTRFSYDAIGNMVSLTDAQGNTTHWSHDHLGRQIAETNHLGATRVTAYDASGNVARIVDRNNRSREFSHDPLFRRTEEKWMEGATTVRTVTFTYNDAGELLSASDPDSTSAHTYDNLGRVTVVNNSGTPGVPNVVLTAGHDALSHRTSLSATVAGVADFLNTYSFDALGHMTRVDQMGQSGGNSVAEKRVDFAYNRVGQFTQIARFNDTDGASSHEVATSVYTRDDLGRLTGLAYQKGGINLFTPYSWSYDAINRVTQFVSQDGTNDYGYNANSELTSASLTSESYAFDATGNRTGGSYATPGPNNQLLSDGTFNYEHDAEGNRTKRTRISTDPADDHVMELTWDHRNRLTEVVFKNNAGTITKVLAYVYDVFDRRILRKLDTTSPFDLVDAAIEGFVYDGDDVILDFLDPDGEGVGAPQAMSMRYLSAVDQIMAQEDVTKLPDSIDRVLWHLPDNVGTTRDLARNDGSIATHITYTAFGQPLTGSITTTRYLFTAREYDAETGLQYNRTRWYDPAVGRWISEDWIGFAAGDVNLSRYVSNSPTNLTDPEGLAGYGHHPFPQSNLATELSAGNLTMDGYNLGMGYTTGQTSPNHGFGKYGGVTHERYNTLVGRAWNNFMGRMGINANNPATPEQVRQFIEKDIGRSKNREIRAFNEAVDKERQKFLKRPRQARPASDCSNEELIKRGKNLLARPKTVGAAGGPKGSPAPGGSRAGGKMGGAGGKLGAAGGILDVLHYMLDYLELDNRARQNGLSIDQQSLYDQTYPNGGGPPPGTFMMQ